MKIEDIRLEKKDGCVRVVAKVIWEDSGRPEQETYFETGQENHARSEPSKAKP